jgi:hypothetical protein
MIGDRHSKSKLINKPMTNSNIIQLTINKYWSLVFIGVGIWVFEVIELYNWSWDLEIDLF